MALASRRESGNSRDSSVSLCSNKMSPKIVKKDSKRRNRSSCSERPRCQGSCGVGRWLVCDFGSISIAFVSPQPNVVVKAGAECLGPPCLPRRSKRMCNCHASSRSACAEAFKSPPERTSTLQRDSPENGGMCSMPRPALAFLCMPAAVPKEPGRYRCPLSYCRIGQPLERNRGRCPEVMIASPKS